MKKILLAAVLTFSLFACKKDNPLRDYGCVYGVSKSTGIRTYIRCGDKEIYNTGYNQVAADKVAAQKKIPQENVIVMKAFTNWEFIPNNKCNCN